MVTGTERGRETEGIVTGTGTGIGGVAWEVIAMTTGTGKKIEVTVVTGAVSGRGIRGGPRSGAGIVTGSEAEAERETTDVATRGSSQEGNGIGLG